MNTSKPRVIKDLIYFNNKDGKRVSALPFETEDKYYLVRMTVYEAEKIIEEDDDYDSTGSLKDSAKEEYENKYGDDEFLSTETEAEEVAEVADEDYDDDDDFDEDEADVNLIYYKLSLNWSAHCPKVFR